MRLKDIERLHELAKELRVLKKVEKEKAERWGHWDFQNGRTSSEHFAFCMDYGPTSVINIPNRYNERFINLVKDIIKEIEKEIEDYGA